MLEFSDAALLRFIADQIGNIGELNAEKIAGYGVALFLAVGVLYAGKLGWLTTKFAASMGWKATRLAGVGTYRLVCPANSEICTRVLEMLDDQDPVYDTIANELACGGLTVRVSPSGTLQRVLLGSSPDYWDVLPDLSSREASAVRKKALRSIDLALALESEARRQMTLQRLRACEVA